METFPQDFKFQGITEEEEKLMSIRDFVYNEFLEAKKDNVPYVLISLTDESDDDVKQVLKEIFKTFPTLGFPEQSKEAAVFTESLKPFVLNDKPNENSVLKHIVKFTRVHGNCKLVRRPSSIDVGSSTSKQFVIPLNEAFLNIMDEHYVWV